MNREIKFILDVLQDKPSIAGKEFDWYWILGFLELNKIGGYFLVAVPFQTVLFD